MFEGLFLCQVYILSSECCIRQIYCKSVSSIQFLTGVWELIFVVFRHPFLFVYTPSTKLRSPPTILRSFGRTLFCTNSMKNSGLSSFDAHKLTNVYLISSNSMPNSIQNVLLPYSSVDYTFSTAVNQNHQQDRQSRQSRCTSSSFNRQHGKGVRNPHGFMGPLSFTHEEYVI